MPRSWPIVISSALLLLLVGVSDDALGQIRIVNYNTLGKPLDSSEDADFQTVLEAIGIKSANGIAKRVDILALQEGVFTSIPVNTFTRIASLMNSSYGVSSYQSSVAGTGILKVGYVYDSSTVDLLSSSAFAIGTRPAHRGQFRPVGYTSSDADFYVYDVHLKAGSTQANVDTRTSESTNLRALADALGDDQNIIYTGDFNFKRSDEPGHIQLLSSGIGQGFDPLAVGFWPSATDAEIVTQSTRTSNIGDGGATGGMDDRFDLQIVSGELLDGEGMSYLGPTSTGLGALDHSYQAFGNDGTSFNQAITTPTTGRSQPTSVLNALHDFSDHLPVFADYQIPAVMDASLSAPAPATINLNDVLSLDVLVENLAAVLAAVGADELDYTLNVSGDLLGGGVADTTLALSGGNTHQVTLDTSSLGLKSGTITVASSSLAVENSLFEIDVDFEVLAGFLEADFNEDGNVDATDLATLEGAFGLTGTATKAQGDANDDQNVNGADFAIWQQQLGQSPLMALSSAVPEPSSIAILLSLAVTLLPRLRTKRGV